MKLVGSPSYFREVFWEPSGEHCWTVYSAGGDGAPAGRIEQRSGSYEARPDAPVGDDGVYTFSTFRAALSYLNEYAYVVRAFFDGAP